MTNVPYSLDACRNRAADLGRRLGDLLRSRDEAAARAAGQRRQNDATGVQSVAKTQQELDAGLQKITDRLTKEQERARAAATRSIARIERAYTAACSKTRKAVRIKIDGLSKEEQKARDAALRNLQEKYAKMGARLVDQRTEMTAHRGEAEELAKSLRSFASGLGVSPVEPDISSETGVMSADEGAPQVKQKLAAVRSGLEELRRAGGIRILRLIPPIVMLFVLLGLNAGLFWAMTQFGGATVATAGSVVGMSFAACFLVYWVLLGGIRKKASTRIGALQHEATQALALLRRIDAAGKSGQEANKIKLLEDKMDVGSQVREQFRAGGDEIREQESTMLEKHAAQQSRLVDRVHRRRDRELERAESRHSVERGHFQEAGKAELDRLTRQQAGQGKELSGRENEDQERLRTDWDRALQEFTRYTGEARQKGIERFPSWSDPKWQDIRMPATFPEAVYIGDARIDLKSLMNPAPTTDVPFPFPGDGSASLPLALTFPSQGSLFLGADLGNRGTAIDALQSTILRLLTAFPPGKAKFLFIDPVALGENFSYLMHLSDFDESLVSSRIWTSQVHIERKLGEITEHIEKVIQKYLRNQYPSIAEYNREVGPLAEPYRFVVVSDFPVGFSDLALERLASIVASGPRCGVHTLILHDQRQPTPPGFDMARLHLGSLVAQAGPRGLVVADDVLKESVLTVERPPAPARLTPMLGAIGKLCVDANRVEVPFEVVAPRDDQFWTLNTEKGIRVPLGRAGADRMLNLDLGKGTAQHALIAGKTGSGKSTLFHVMITNLASWFSPREIEFYLIDYKKGVEFKTYATNKLPHARVIAIESDREFGLSVLQRLDREFAHRADLFRKAGVQDFASYRREGKDEYLPRTLLLIDEFQEFFVEEDAIAQEASLLLDRIVRQGRAFGVHVILGSQTLGGSYSLAKATLGQMGVRIALQCNEADSYLILSDDNAAARLLSRPGDAIYNDMSGLIEGNNPFQVVWLPDEVQERAILKSRDRAEREGWQPLEPPTIFEGNVPADIRNNLFLKKRIETTPVVGDDAVECAWIGEANSIKGPSEVNFRNQGGSNLLVIGQQREAALGIVMSAVISLGAAHPPKSARFVILDGSPPELGAGAKFSEIAKTVPQDVELVDYAKVPQSMEELHAEMKARQESGKRASSPIYVIIYDLQRFRKLRASEEYDLGGGSADKPAPDKCLAAVLTDGPALGIHTIVWCDSLGNLTRTFTRKTLREFEMRILFQMSPSDSSELIDSPHASKLGAYRGLLFLEQEGTVEKFRPYSPAESDWLADVRRALAGRPLKSPDRK